LPTDSLDQPAAHDGVVARVDLAGGVLVLGDPAGMTIAPADGRGSADSLAQALAQERKEREPAAVGLAPLAGAVDDAAQVTSKVERAVKLFTEIAQGRLDPAAVSDEVDALVGLLGRLDRDERWAEALRMARSLATLLALLGRWLELIKSLKLALSAAEQLGDTSGQAWALHELGTLHLAAGERTEAERLLSQARAMREQIGDRLGLATTDRNLQFLCRDLRALIHCDARESVLEWIGHKPVAALALGAAMLLAGGAAGALVRGAGNPPATVTVTGPTTTVVSTRTVTTRSVVTRTVFVPTPTDGTTTKRTLSIERTGSGTVTSSDGTIECGSRCSNSYAIGAQVTLTATPAAGSVFKGWGGHVCTGTGPCLLKLSADESVVAEFAPAGLR
jgi:hypothetical protein